MVTKLTEKNFEAEIIKSSEPVVIDCYADWCGPCQIMKPIVYAIAEEQKGKIKYATLDVDVESDLAMKLGIMSMPTFVIFGGGKEMGRIVGAMNREKFLAKVSEFIVS